MRIAVILTKTFVWLTFFGMSGVEKDGLPGHLTPAVYRGLEPMKRQLSDQDGKIKNKLQKSMQHDLSEEKEGIDVIDEAYLNQLLTRLDPSFHTQASLPLPGDSPAKNHNIFAKEEYNRSDRLTPLPPLLDVATERYKNEGKVIRKKPFLDEDTAVSVQRDETPPQPIKVAKEDIKGRLCIPKLMMQPASHQTQTQSSNLTTVFIQQQTENGVFVEVEGPDSNNLGVMTCNSRLEPDKKKDLSGVNFAMACHLILRRLSLILHGVFAGVSLWDCVVSNVISRQSGGHINLLLHYYSFPITLHSLYLLLLITVIITLLDRCDIGSLTMTGNERNPILTSDVALYASLCLLVFIFLVSVCITFLDEQLMLFLIHPILWTDLITNSTATATATVAPVVTVNGVTFSVIATQSVRVTVWLVIAIIRSICSCISWLLMVWASNRDRMEGMLCKLSADADNHLMT